MQKSLTRVAKKKFDGREADMERFTRETMGNVKTTTDA